MRAVQKRGAGETPNQRELAALRRFEKQQEERRRWDYYRTIPKKHYREMAGLQNRQLLDQAATYSLPIDGATVDLPKLVHAWHRFLAANHRKLAAPEDDEAFRDGETTEALEEWRRHKARLAELDVEEREGNLLPRDAILDMLSRCAGLLRKAGDLLQRHHGAEAYQVLDTALVDFDREVSAVLERESNDDGDGQNSTTRSGDAG